MTAVGLLTFTMTRSWYRFLLVPVAPLSGFKFSPPSMLSTNWVQWPAVDPQTVGIFDISLNLLSVTD